MPKTTIFTTVKLTSFQWFLSRLITDIIYLSSNNNLDNYEIICAYILIDIFFPCITKINYIGKCWNYKLFKNFILQIANMVSDYLLVKK